MTTNSPENRDTSGRFLPGISGNPRGRPVGLSGLNPDILNNDNPQRDPQLGLFVGELVGNHTNSRTNTSDKRS